MKNVDFCLVHIVKYKDLYCIIFFYNFRPKSAAIRIGFSFPGSSRTKSLFPKSLSPLFTGLISNLLFQNPYVFLLMRLCNDVETNPGPGSKSPTKQRRGGGRQRGRGGPGGGSRGPSNYNTEDESDSNRSFDRRGSTLESRHEQLAEKVDGLKEQVSYNLITLKS